MFVRFGFVFLSPQQVSATSIYFESLPYQVDQETGLIDYEVSCYFVLLVLLIVLVFLLFRLLWMLLPRCATDNDCALPHQAPSLVCIPVLPLVWSWFFTCNPATSELGFGAPSEAFSAEADYRRC